MTPINNAQCYALKGPKSRLRRVPILFGIGRPFAILRRVMTIVVDAFNRPTFWARTHIGDKVSEIIPSFTGRDAAAAISRIVRILRTIATSTHGCPTPVFLRGRVMRRSAVRSHFLWICVSMIRLTSSAMEMPRRFASRLRNARCGSVNEIICLVKLWSRLHLRTVRIERPVLWKSTIAGSLANMRGKISCLLPKGRLETPGTPFADAIFVSRCQYSFVIDGKLSPAFSTRLFKFCLQSCGLVADGPLASLAILVAVISPEFSIPASGSHSQMIPQGIQ